MPTTPLDGALFANALARLSSDSALAAAALVCSSKEASDAERADAKRFGSQALEGLQDKKYLGDGALAFMSQMLRGSPEEAADFASRFPSLLSSNASHLLARPPFRAPLDNVLAAERSAPGCASTLPAHALAERPPLAARLRRLGLLSDAKAFDIACRMHALAHEEEGPEAAQTLWQACVQLDPQWPQAFWNGFWSRSKDDISRMNLSACEWLPPSAGDDIFEPADRLARSQDDLTALAAVLASHAQAGRLDCARSLGQWLAARDPLDLAGEAARQRNRPSAWIQLPNPKPDADFYSGWLAPLNASAQALCAVVVRDPAGRSTPAWQAWADLALGLAEGGAPAPLFELQLADVDGEPARTGSKGIFSASDQGKKACLLLAGLWSRMGAGLDPIAEQWFLSGATPSDRKLLSKAEAVCAAAPEWQGCAARCQALDIRLGLKQSAPAHSAPRL